MTAPTSPGVVPADDVRELVERLRRMANDTHFVWGTAYQDRAARDMGRAADIIDRLANRPSLTEYEWRTIESAPHDTDILIGGWFEDDSSGYFGGSRWKWIASGRIESGGVWIDVNDEFHGQISELIGFDKPTHWRPLLQDVST